MSTRVPFVEAMQSQPELLEEINGRLAALTAEDLPRWEPGSSLGVLAMGASRNSAHALVTALAAEGVRSVNPPASELLLASPEFVPADYLLVVSESGRSPEPLEAAARIGGSSRVGITNFPDAQIGEVVEASIGFGGVPDSGVYTVGYTATLLAYAHLLDRLGIRSLDADVAEAPALVARALQDHAAEATDVAGWIAEATAVDVVGQGASYATAAELALMLREGVRLPSGLYETYEYLHGPMEAVTPSSLVVLFGDGRELTVPGRLVEAGVRVVLVTSAAPGTVPAEGHELLRVIRVPQGLSPFVRPVVEVVVAQLLLAAGAERMGIPVDEFVFEGLGTKLDEQAAVA